jgi:hypothetical protein
MKLSLLKFKTHAYLRKNKALRASLPYKQAMNIGVIFTVEDKMKHEEIKDFVKHLEQDGKQVKVISFLPRNKDNYEFMFDFFSDKDLSFWGNITSPGAEKFVQTPFDLLYYLDITPNPLILNLIAKSKARCRVGKYWTESHLFLEMMIESKPDTKSLIENMYKYTKWLK